MTTDEVRESMKQVMIELRDGTMDVKTASEITNAAGKIINSIKVDLAGEMLRSSNLSYTHPCLRMESFGDEQQPRPPHGG